jgi:hypothetical protein
MLELDAEIDSRIQFPSITGRTWNPASQEIEKVDANPPSGELNGNLSTADDLAGVFNEKDLSAESWRQAFVSPSCRPGQQVTEALKAGALQRCGAGLSLKASTR